MRQEIRRWSSENVTRAQASGACGPTCTRSRRGSGGKDANEGQSGTVKLGRYDHMPTRIMLVAVLILIWPAFPVLASMQTVHAVGEHRMGDFETKQEAIRLATEAAKRDALEQAVIYLESLTVVKDLTIVKEEDRKSVV